MWRPEPADSVASVLDLATGRPGRRRDLPGGDRAARPGVCSRLVPGPIEASRPWRGSSRESHPRHAGRYTPGFRERLRARHREGPRLHRGDRCGAHGDGQADHGGLHRQSAVARRRAQGRVHVHERPRRAIELPVEFDFMAVSSYGSATRTSGVVRIIKDLDLDLTDRHVLIVEDIVDSGLTLAVPAEEPRRPRPALARGVRAAREGRSPEGPTSTCSTSASASRPSS